MDDCANAQYPPITGKLREKLAEYEPTEDGYTLTTYPVGQTGYARLVELCDTIDAILEYAEDREKKIRQIQTQDADIESLALELRSIEEMLREETDRLTALRRTSASTFCVPAPKYRMYREEQEGHRTGRSV